MIVNGRVIDRWTRDETRINDQFGLKGLIKLVTTKWQTTGKSLLFRTCIRTRRFSFRSVI